LSKTDKFTPKYFAMPLAHAIHASSNAPVNYFDAAAVTRPAVIGPKPSFETQPYHTPLWYWDGVLNVIRNSNS